MVWAPSDEFVFTVTGALALGASFASLGACGGDTFEVTIDGSAEPRLTSPHAPALIPVPEPPAMPAQTDLPTIPCRPNWQATAVGDDPALACEPWAIADPPRCPDAQVRFVGEASCADVESPCPSGSFRGAIPSGVPRVYVLAGAVGGDGTEASPFGTITSALSASAPGDVLVIGKGRYNEALVLDRPATLMGACPAETVIDGTGLDPLEALVAVRAEDVVLAGLGLADPQGDALTVQSGASAELNGVVVQGARGAAIRVTGGEANASHLVIDDSGSEAGDVGAVTIQSGGRLTVDKAIVSNSRRFGVLVRGSGAQVTLRDVAVSETRQLTELRAGPGLLVAEGASAAISGGLFERNGRVGVEVLSGAELTIEDSVVRATRLADDPVFVGDWGHGLRVTGGSASVRRSLLDGNRSWGLWVGPSGIARGDVHYEEPATIVRSSSVTLEDVVIADTQSRVVNGNLGGGFSVSSINGPSARLDGARVYLSRNREVGIRIWDGEVDISDLVVEHTLPQERSGEGGWGMQIVGGDVTLRRANFRRNREAGIYALRPNTRARFTDVEITESQSHILSKLHGRGMHVAFGAQVILERALISENRETSIGVYGPSTALTLSDVTVRQTSGRDADGAFGAGVSVVDAAFDASRLDLERNRHVSLWVGRGSRASVTDLLVRSALPQECAGGCEPFGTGIGVYQGADLEVRRFHVLDAALCGVHVAAGGNLTLSEGTVEQSVFGACVDQDDFDVDALSHDVMYRANVKNLQGQALPVPDAPPSLAGAVTP